MAARLAGTVSLISLLACSSQAPEKAGDGGGAGAASVTFAEVYRAVLAPCTSCHAGIVARFNGLDLGTQATAYTNLVGVHASGNCSGIFVVRGSAATSVLYQKVTSPRCGSLMPQNAPPLSQANLDLLKRWIDEGAPDN
jgi:hypothetical protein